MLIEIIVFVVLIYIAISIFEYKQKMRKIDLKERLFRLKHGLPDDYTNDE